MDPTGDVWVFHRGALGDSVLLWPALRAMVARGVNVTLATDVSKAALAEREIGVRGVNLEQRRFNDLWVTGAHREPGRVAPVARVGSVVSFLHTQAKERTWAENATAMFPGAAVRSVERPLDRRLALEWMAECGGGVEGLPLLERAPLRPVVIHVGAGSPAKRWPMHLWKQVHEGLRAQGCEVLVLAGEVELEQFSPEESALLNQMQGKHPRDLTELASVLRRSRLVVTNDSGPGHLAAALGARTLALFGPSVPERWAPIGRDARVIAPPTPAAMDWLRADRVLAEIGLLLDDDTPAPRSHGDRARPA